MWIRKPEFKNHAKYRTGYAAVTNNATKSSIRPAFAQKSAPASNY